MTLWRDAVAEPTYTITIPMGVQLVKGGTTSTFKAEGISNLNGGKIVLSITSTRKSGMPDDCPDFALYRGHNYVPYEVQGFYKDGPLMRTASTATESSRPRSSR